MVKLADIIAVRPGSCAGADSQAASHSKFARSNIELVAVGTDTSFSIYHVVHASGHKLRHGRIVFHASDATVITQWVDRVNDILARPGSILVVYFTCKPHELENRLDPFPGHFLYKSPLNQTLVLLRLVSLGKLSSYLYVSLRLCVIIIQPYDSMCGILSLLWF